MSNPEQRFHASSAFQPEHIAQKMTVETQPDHSLETWLTHIHDTVLRAYPSLEGVRPDVLFSDPHAHTESISGMHLPPTNEEPHEILVQMGSEKHLQHARQERPIAFAVAAELLGILPEELNAEVFNSFVFLHEFGHAHDYVTNFQQVPELSHLTPDELALVWQNEHVQEKEALPIPSLAPAEILEQLQTMTWEQFLDAHPHIRTRLAEQNLHTQEEALAAQDRAYRSMPSEHYADKFAAAFIREHLSASLNDSEKSA